MAIAVATIATRLRRLKLMSLIHLPIFLNSELPSWVEGYYLLLRSSKTALSQPEMYTQEVVFLAGQLC